MLDPLAVLQLYPSHKDTLAGLLASRARPDPDRPLLAFDDRHYTWHSFDTEVHRVSSLLEERKVKRGDRVAIIATNSDAHISLMFALARRGAAMVPLNPAFGVAELEYILAHAQLSGIIVCKSVLPNVREALGRAGLNPWLMCLGGSDVEAADFFAPADTAQTTPTGQPDDTCLIIYTSGTTGMPKGVMHSQKNYIAIAEVACGRTGLQPGDKVLVILPFFHVNALFYSIGSLFAAGASGTILPRFSASTFWDSVVETKATQVNIIEAVGNILQKRSRYEFRPNHKLRVVYGVREAFVHTFREEFGIAQLVTGFGMSECPGVICNPLGDKQKPGSIGVPSRHPDTSRPWTQARIVNESGEDVSNGEVGELWLRSPTLMQGYFRDPEQTQAAYHDGWFMTGDLVRRDSEGYFYFVSRKKDIIRRRGENISGAELDRIIGEHPAIYEAAAIAVPSELGEDDILVAVVRKKDADVSAGEIAQWCRERLAPMKVPRFVIFLDELPHTATHKVSKAVLRADETLQQRATDLEK